jgi:hypothetical protein
MEPQVAKMIEDLGIEVITWKQAHEMQKAKVAK